MQSSRQWQPDHPPPRETPEAGSLTPQPLGGAVCLRRWALVHRLRRRSQHWRTPRPLSARQKALGLQLIRAESGLPAQRRLCLGRARAPPPPWWQHSPAPPHPDRGGLTQDLRWSWNPLGDPSAPSRAEPPRACAGRLDSVHASERQTVRV